MIVLQGQPRGWLEPGESIYLSGMTTEGVADGDYRMVAIIANTWFLVKVE